jgi:pseudaminic acid synthase
LNIGISNRFIGPGHPTYIIAEMSANHNQDFDRAVEIVKVAKMAGADAIKLQTYTPDTITFNSESEYFKIDGGLWSGQTLYELYQSAYTPWEWQPRLKEEADKVGLSLFSSPFDHTAVDFLAQMNVPAYKIASFELVDLPLIDHVAKQGRPIIMSTGMASLEEIAEAVERARASGNEEIVLLKCVSAYPAAPEEMNLLTIRHLRDTFGCPVGLSDHTLGHEVAVAAVALGANVIEKHFTLSRNVGGPDAAFSMEPDEFETMVKTIRLIEKALGRVCYEPTKGELRNKQYRRSLFIARDMKKGDEFTPENVKSFRPAAGLEPKYLYDVLGRVASGGIKAGTPLSWEHVTGGRHKGEK